MEKIIRLTESDLHNIVKESVNRILKEVGETENGQRLLGRLAARKSTSGDYDGYARVTDYAKEKQGGDLMKRDKFAKGFHSEKDKLREEGEIGGGGATNCVGINVGGAAGQAKNHIDAAPFSNKPLKQKHNLGNPTTKKANMVDITPALDRTPGFSMGERVGDKKKK
jgi:hypothetical protein